jgi:hypothetical protein
MKKFKQFKSEQQVINEIGPIGVAMMGAMGIFGGGIAAFKLFKKGKEAIKGYKETKAEKKDNKEAGVFIDKKIFNPETGKEETETIPLYDPGDGKAGMSNDEIEKEQKKAQKKQDIKNKKAKFKYVEAEKKNKEAIKGGKVLKYDPDSGEYSTEDPETDEPETTDEPEEPETTEPEEAPTDEPEDKVERDKDGNLKNQDDAEAAYKASNFTKAPAGWQKDPDDEKKVVKRGEKKKKGSKEGEKEAGAAALAKRKEKLAKIKAKKAEAGNDKEKLNQWFIFTKNELSSLTEEDRTQILEDLVLEEVITLTESKELQVIVEMKSKVLRFGEFISEDVMSDLLKATKSKKDSEITLDDGADIPIDPLTASILVKYIEELGSSEKTKTINKIQRTERAFMKVLGQAHGE